MNLERWREVERVVAAALELPASQQTEYLMMACGHSAGLRAAAESLLEARTAAERLETHPPYLAELAGMTPPPTKIGRYRILRVLGEGGMGTVFEAEQEQPCRRVALKVIRAGFVSPETVRRFEREAQALGRLQHPGIAQIHEAGAADAGFGPQPYFAMEYICGESLLRYAEAHRLDALRKLDLMSKICVAVHHAHLRGIIHCDLKPGNILVDETGQPKILDFGVAHMTDRDAPSTRYAGTAGLAGTLAYMSPEQAAGDPLQIDTRTDVYALGLILFELLAGRRPYPESERLHEAVRTIWEQDAARLGSINRNYRGDIEAIAAKALAKDKTRRYASAAELDADLQKYFRNEPLAARQPSAAYRAQKFVRRHRTLVAATAAVFAVLLVAVVMSMREATRARQAEQAALIERDRAARAGRLATEERDRAMVAEKVATTERNRAIAEKERADNESVTAKSVTDFLQNDLLAQASSNAQARPDIAPNPDLKVRTALDRAAARISARFGKQPLIEATTRRTIGNTYMDLGLYTEAQQQLTRALDLSLTAFGDDHPDTLSAMNALAAVYHEQGKYALAEPLLVRALRGRRRVLGDGHPDTLKSMNDLAVVYRREGRYALAEPLYVKVLEARRHVLGEEHPDALTTMTNLATLYLYQGKTALAEPLLLKAFDGLRRVLGDEHPDTLSTMTALAGLYNDQGKYAQAEILFNKDLEISRRVLGKEHADTLVSLNNIGVLHIRRGTYNQAEPLLVELVETRRRVLGEQHPDTLGSMSNLATVYKLQGNYTKAEELLSKAMDLHAHALGDEHPGTLRIMNSLASLYEDQGHYALAERLFEKVLTVGRRVLGADHPDRIKAEVSLAQIRLEQQTPADAESLVREALKGLEKRQADRWNRYDAESVLGSCLAAQGKFAEAEALLVSGYRGLLQRRATIPWENRSVMKDAGGRILQLYRDWQKPTQFGAWRAELEMEHLSQ